MTIKANTPNEYRPGTRRPFDWLAIAYSWAAALNALAVLFWIAKDQPIRGAIVGVATPIWILCVEVRRG